MSKNYDTRLAYFAGGCFWCITPVFAGTDGVLSVTAGYCGGDEKDPVYEDVKLQRTHHRETIRIEYDASTVTYSELLRIFLGNTDLTDDGGQYIDRGFSYTLAVYCCSEEEKAAAEESLAEIENKTGIKPCVSVEWYKHFYCAEDSHQDYYLKNPEAIEKEMRESGRRTARED